jgi:glycosyltransferase involved in cell wall biosynthesis
MTELLTSTEVTMTAADPLVSVIIANYNYGRFLAEAIESVLAQTYRNFELIVVDDGSTDNSRKVIESYGDRLKAIFQENAGQGGAFNVGIARSKGEIICFLDSDDYFHREKLAKVVAGFLDHPEWVQISHGRTSVDREGAIIGRDPTFFSQGDVRNLLLQWGRYAWAVTSALAYRRSALQQVLPIPTKQSEVEVITDQKTDHLAFGAADTYLTATVPFYGKVGCIREPLMFYRSHGDNKQSRSINLPYLIRQRELTAAYINQAASKVGLNRHFELQRDSDYRSFKALQSGGASWTEALQIIWLTWQESMAIRHDAKDTLERLLRRSVCALFPSEAKTFLRFGPRRYLRFKITAKQPQNLELSGKDLNN